MNHLAVNGISAAAGGILTVVLGGWDQLLTVFLITILIDYATGVLASIKEGSGLDSQVGFWGLTRKALMLLVIVLAHQMDVLIGSGSDVIKTGAIIFTCPTNSYRFRKLRTAWPASAG
ncbi:holin family protein [Paenibacillus sp. AR247]|uniref:phage holin family protein n=1 Tax=Paenibacillus sp. AR247 TaxID=1631599 RepID=UPI0026991EC7